MSKFILKVENGKPGFGNEAQHEKYKHWLKFREGKRIVITDFDYESKDQRGFFEGGVVPLIVFLDGRDYKDNDECRRTREALKLEFNGELTVLKGKSIKISASTKGQLNNGFLDRVVDWAEEQYAIDRTQVLNPKDYDKWRDTIFPFQGPDTYIDYLLETGRLRWPGKGSFMNPLTPVRK